MTLSPRGTDRNRTTVALVFLVLGVLLLLWAWGSWVFRTGAAATPSIPAEAMRGAERPGAVTAAPAFPFWLIPCAVLVLALLLGTYALGRSGRRLREAKGPEPARASSAMDAPAERSPPDLDNRDEPGSEDVQDHD